MFIVTYFDNDPSQGGWTYNLYSGETAEKAMNVWIEYMGEDLDPTTTKIYKIEKEIPFK